MTKRAIVQATQVMIAFQIEGDGEQDIRDLIKLLTSVGLFLFGAWQWASRKRQQLRGFTQDCQEAASFTVKVMDIGLTAWLYGMGVKV
jgi:hypothetical protein